MVHRPIRRQHIDVIRNLFAVDNLPLLCLDVAVDLYDTSICKFECVVTFGYFKCFFVIRFVLDSFVCRVFNSFGLDSSGFLSGFQQVCEARTRMLHQLVRD